jgi:CRISPR-associated exonuclease Cas4
MAVGALLFLLFVLAAFCLLVARSLRQRSGLPQGAIIYEDAGGKASRVLVSQRYSLRGKPDYILNDGGRVIPVELKSGAVPRSGRPHRSHVLQLAVYFLLVEDVLRRDVAYGLVRYKDGSLRVENTNALREELLAVVAEMREALLDEDVPRNHNQAYRCRACSMAHACDERLA